MQGCLWMGSQSWMSSFKTTNGHGEMESAATWIDSVALGLDWRSTYIAISPQL